MKRYLVSFVFAMSSIGVLYYLALPFNGLSVVAVFIMFISGMFAGPKQSFKEQYEDFEARCLEIIEKIMPKDKVVDFGQIYFKYDNCFWQVEVWQLKSFSSEPAACIYKFPVSLLSEASLEKYLRKLP